MKEEEKEEEEEEEEEEKKKKYDSLTPSPHFGALSII
jgi:hypothetical protein